ncbi:MAG: hypothetical protein OXI87_19015 [Albidovulum sp.]|nr:hypothetical protein [Albidovulum sp.]
MSQTPCLSRCSPLLNGRRQAAAAIDNPLAQGRTIPVRGPPNTQIPQDRGAATTRIDMAIVRLPGVRHRQVQLPAQILQAFRAEIFRAGRKTVMCPEKTELEGNPYPAVVIETLYKIQIVEIQAPAFQKRSTGHVQIPQAKMPDPRSAEGRCQRLVCARSVLSDVHICSFGPFTPRNRRSFRWTIDLM